MAQRSSKHSEVKTTIAGFDGGLNLYDGSSSISDNQLVDCRNYYYAEEGDELVTRPGVKVVSRVRIGEVLLTVVLHPAQGGWRIVGSSVWLASGVQLSLPAGVGYTLEYQDVDGYRTPGGSTVTLVEDTIINAYYLEVIDYYDAVIEDMAQYGTNCSFSGTHPPSTSDVTFSVVNIVKLVLPFKQGDIVSSFRVAILEYGYLPRDKYIITFFLRPNADGVPMRDDMLSEHQSYWNVRDKSGTLTTESFCVFDRTTADQYTVTDPSDPRYGDTYTVTADLSAAIMEIINQPGWRAGNQVALYLRSYPTDYDLGVIANGYGGLIDGTVVFPHCRSICSYQTLA